MLVDRQDGACRTCGGQLEVMDATDATLEVTCTECADTYDVEPDAFGDGCMTYYFPLMTKRLLGEDHDDAP